MTRFFVIFAHLYIFVAVASAAALRPRKPLHTIQKYAGQSANGYVVRLKDSASQAGTLKNVDLTGRNVATNWQIFNGFAGNLDQESLSFLLSSEDVESVSENGIATVSGAVTQYVVL